MDPKICNKLRNVVTRCRKLLEESSFEQLEGKYGIFVRKDVVIADPDAEVPGLSGEENAARKDILEHFEHIKARGFAPKEALEQLVREIAFTHLNRLCAYKMMEAREVYIGGQKFREAVTRGVHSNGVKFYLADNPEDERLFNTGHQDVAYRHFLDWLGGLLSDEVGVLFNPNDSANRLYPGKKALDEVLELLNQGAIKADEVALREAWPKIWSEDETIGWVYQFFTPQELRNEARKESTAPRNSYELAFLNQFFTPRYIVEFLTDNTLGRMWYEMRKGDTALKLQCKYMLRRPTEVFLEEGELPPSAAAGATDGPIHYPYRPKKDPRALKILDPACGSGHFLLYCFDLLLSIYEEAYEDPDLGPAIESEYETIEKFREAIPSLILAHNLNGIDIDSRASQIAALALWLRCQRAYQEMGLKKGRPKITRSNFVSAEPMPGEKHMLEDFVGQLEPRLLGQLVELVFESMQLAGEAGSLLKIEEKIRDGVAGAKKQWLRDTAQATDKKGQPLLFTQVEMDRLDGKQEQPSPFDLSNITDDQFFERAEANVIEALREYAKKAQDGQRLQRRLFAEDAERGFAFVDLCRKRFDVVLMNPPFGETSPRLEKHLADSYQHWNKNLLCAFIERAYQISSPAGMVGVLYDRTAVVKSTYEKFRRSNLIPDSRLHSFADLGWGVLDANVEVAASVLSHTPINNGVFLDARDIPVDAKGAWIVSQVKCFTDQGCDKAVTADTSVFSSLPNAVIGYDFPEFLRNAFQNFRSLKSQGFVAHQGHSLKSEKHNRVWWELPLAGSAGFSSRMFNGAGFSPYYANLFMCVVAPLALAKLPKDSATVLRSQALHGLPGICFGKRGEYFCAHALPRGHIFTDEGQAMQVADSGTCLEILGYLNTPVARMAINRYCGQHKHCGYINLLPYHPLPDAPLVRQLVRDAIISQLRAGAFDEIQSHFSLMSRMQSLSDYATAIKESLERASTATQTAEDKCHELSLELLRLNTRERTELEAFRARQPKPIPVIAGLTDDQSIFRFAAHSTISQAVGILFGRWDIRPAGSSTSPIEMPEPFEALNQYSPAMLKTEDGDQVGKAPVGYPIQVETEGILVDDPHHPDDVLRRLRDVLEILWPERVDDIEREACGILNVSDLREYFRKLGKGGFWDDHISRYSKSRRKAPIYWLLQSSKKNYGLWIYYQRLDKDLLFKALHRFVDPKIRLEKNALKLLEAKKAEAGGVGKVARDLAKKVDDQVEFLSELHEFEDKLRRAANLNLEPNHSDGVLLNIASLHELVPWSEAEECWKELSAGKYEWSAVGKQLHKRLLA